MTINLNSTVTDGELNLDGLLNLPGSDPAAAATGPSDNAPASSSQRSVILWYFVLWVISLAFQLVTSVTYGVPDPITYAQVGKLLLRGQSLYDEIGLDKPLLTALIHAGLQLPAPNTYWIFKFWLAMILGLQGALILWQLRPPLSAAFCISLLVLFLPLTYWDWAWLSIEHLSNTFAVGVLLACWKISRENQATSRMALVLGLLLGCGFLIRPQQAMIALIPLTTLLCINQPWSRRLSLLGLVGISGAATLIISIALVAMVGSVRHYLYFLFVFPRIYATGSDPINLKYLLSVTRTWQYLLPLLFLLGCWGCCVRSRVLVLSSFASGILATVASPRPHMHYFMAMLPSLMLALGICSTEELRLPAWFHSRWKEIRQPVGWVLVTMIAVPMSQQVMEYTYQALRSSNIISQGEVARWVDKQFPQSRTLWVVAPSIHNYILYASHKMPVHAVRTPWELNLKDHNAVFGGSEAILNDYLRKPPDLILLHKAYWSWLPDSIESAGDLEGSLPFRIFRALLAQKSYERQQTTYAPPSDPAQEYIVFVRKSEPTTADSVE